MGTDYKIVFLEMPQFCPENSRNALHLSEIDLPDIEIWPPESRIFKKEPVRK